MFGRGKTPKRLTEAEYWDEYRRLRFRWPDGSLEHAPSVQALVVMAVGVLDKHFNYNGGINWDEQADQELLETLREHLLGYAGFTSEESKRVEWALTEILLCGRELETEGESSRDATEAINILVSRVVDWINAHPNEIKLGDNDEGYVGHF